MVYWYNGILVYWYIGILVYWYTGILVCSYTGIMVYWYIGRLVYWYIGVFRGRSLLINDLLDVDIFTEYIKTLNRFYAVVRSVAFLWNCSFKNQLD